MKRTMRILVFMGIVTLCLMMGLPVLAQESSADRFPEGVIVVPQGTSIAIDDDAGTVTITNCPVPIVEGDTFVVYLQDLPIGYVANAVSEEDGQTVITAEKADKAIYSLLEEEGVVELSPDMYDFVPAQGVT